MSARDIENILDLSPLQKGMLFHTLRDPAAGYYFEQVTFGIPTRLDEELFSRACDSVLRRHAILRGHFAWEKLSKPVMVVRRRAEMPVEVLDWTRMTEPEQLAEFGALLDRDRQRGLDLTRSPLMRMTLVRRKASLCQLVASFHHAILDGWSLNIVFRDLLEIYRTLEAGRVPQLEAAPDYGRFIDWLARQDRPKAEGFWRERLRGYRGRAPFAMDRGFALVPHAKQGVQHLLVTVDEDVSGRLAAVARRYKVTLNVVLQVAWAALAARHTENDDVVLGTVVSGRPPELEGIEQMVGLFINTLPLRIDMSRERRLPEIFASTHDAQARQRDVEYCSLADIAGWSEVSGAEQLFDTLFIFENLPGSANAAAVSSFAFERTNYPLTILIAPGARVGVKLLFETPRFDSRDVAALLQQYRAVLSQIAEWPDRTVGEIAVADEGGGAAVADRAAPTSALPRLETLWALRVNRERDAAALVLDERTWTVAELDAHSERLADALVASGVRHEDVVGILLAPSEDLVAAILACSKAGAAFLLMDPTYPVERLRLMAAQTTLRCLITTDATPWPDLAVVSPEARPTEARAPTGASCGADAAAYVIFTSGSSGVPKAIVQTHRATINRLGWMWREFPYTDDDVCCQRTSLGFVDVIAEILGPILGGAPLVLLDGAARRDAAAMLDALRRHEVTWLVAVPSLLNALLDHAPDLGTAVPSLKLVVSSGEQLRGDLAACLCRALPRATLLNLYGSSEVAADASCAVVRSPSENLPIPIGEPIDGLRLYTLDAGLAPVPLGAAGEIYVAGVGLARGYLRSPAETAERFLPDPFNAGERMYRTGDRGRRLPDGSVEYLGRSDAQIKVRGLRIEPAEVERALNAIAGVRAAVVHADARGALVATLVASTDQVPEAVELRRVLTQVLPSYLVPQRFRFIDTLPLLPNGKVDRRAIAALPDVPERVRAPSESPVTETEVMLSVIWAELLGTPRIARDDDFFALGGHSILTMQLASRVLKKSGRELPLAVIFERPRLRDMATWLDRAGTAATPEGPSLTRRSREARGVQIER